tara:strand:- start:1 stop:714 length:714 start_codon:yes stop_codon:yes gene_type:complete
MSLEKAYEWYKSHTYDVHQSLKELGEEEQWEGYNQLNKLIEEIKDEFNFQKIICVETGASQNKNDGAIGLFFAKLCELTNGEFHSVENNLNILGKSKSMYEKHGVKVKHYLQDSVEFLKSIKIVPNLIHLDSWDLDLMNPFPSALHGWREFTAIEDKMPIGSIIIIDDNFFKGTWVNYNVTFNGEYNGEVKRIDIEYPIVGKGCLIYNFVEGGSSNWKKLSKDVVGSNQKIIFKKIK